MSDKIIVGNVAIARAPHMKGCFDITHPRGSSAIDGIRLLHSDLDDLAVAMDIVRQRYPRVEPDERHNAILEGAHELARTVWQLTGARAHVRVAVSEGAFVDLVHTGIEINSGDITAGRIRYRDDVEVIVLRSGR